MKPFIDDYLLQKIDKVRNVCLNDPYFKPYLSALDEVKKEVKNKDVISYSSLCSSLNTVYEKIKQESYE